MGDPAEELTKLIAATSVGDRSAFRALYDRTAPKLLGVVLRIVRDRSVAEEVVQDVFLRVWQNAGGYTPDAGRPMTWLIAIARHRAIDVIRARPPNSSQSDYVEDDAVNAVPDPRNHVAEWIDAERLGICLDGLEPSHRECFLLAYRDGYSREELASRFGRPVNTVKTWLHRSAAALRACLGDA